MFIMRRNCTGVYTIRPSPSVNKCLDQDYNNNNNQILTYVRFWVFSSPSKTHFDFTKSYQVTDFFFFTNFRFFFTSLRNPLNKHSQKNGQSAYR